MFTQINSAGIHGMEGFLVSVEADVSNGLPGFSISGQLALEVREAQERVRTALKNSNFQLPVKKITVNLSPAGSKKEGTAFDLPIAAAVLGAFGLLEAEKLKDSLLIGELGLDGSVKPVRGVLILVSTAKKLGFRRCFLPVSNVAEGDLIEGIQIAGVKSLKHLQDLLSHDHLEEISREEQQKTISDHKVETNDPFDFREICGQSVLRRAAEVAAAGRHGLLMCGSAGTGKTMVAKRIPTILPALSWEENIEISKIYSLCGLLPAGQPLLSHRPFRSPHHTISPQGLTGGGKVPKPGELSLASGGVLFLDELPHFSRGAIEALREPLEEHRITISRVSGSYEFPADFLIIGAMNPCPCGFFPDRSRCTCTPMQIQNYLNRLSRPILERFDICVEAAPVTFSELEDQNMENEDSAAIRSRVEKAVKIQAHRFQGTNVRTNSCMGQREIQSFCKLKGAERRFARRVYEARGMSARGYHRVLKTARTIADLDGEEWIQKEHLSEAFGYRALEERIWGKKH